MSLADRAAGRDVLDALAAHLEASGISIEEVGRIARLGGYQSVAKLRQDDGTDQLVKSDLFKWEISPAFADGPEWQPVDRGPAVRLPKRAVKPADVDGWSTAVIWPDTQIGYYRDVDGGLVATHDEAAIEVALAVVRAVAPDLVVRVGDDLDLPEFGRYRLTPAFAMTTQSSIDRATLLAAQQRDAVGDGRIVYLAGNHEERLANHLLDNARAAYGLRRGRFGDAPPAAWPVMSVPYLCRLDEFDVEFRPGFPASDVQIGDGLRAVHGLHVSSRGMTASKYLDREKSSVVYGHVHRREYAARTFVDDGKVREIFAASPGCLARRDGAVPSTKGATDLDGRPILGGSEDWQQGVGIAHHQAGRVVYENVAINTDGPTRWAMYGGRTFEAETA